MPETFDYLSIEPIRKSIPPQKQEAKRHYGVHPYFTRRSWNVVQAYIKNFTQPGDLVVDPFGGSGVTAIEALVLKRRAIHIDINPLANFITRCVAIAPVNIDYLTQEFDRVKKETCTYFKHLARISDEKAALEPIKDWYPKNIRLPLNADWKYVHELFSPKQLRALAHLRASIIKTDDKVIRDLLFYVFSATLQKCNLTVTQTIKDSKPRGGAISSILKVGRYWKPKKPIELFPWDEFEEKFSKFLESKKETNREIVSAEFDKNIKILKSDATQLKSVIPTESVDYIYTDPPYGAHIAYLDLSTMWNAWLELPVSELDRQAEVIEDGDLNKTKEDYTERLRQSIHEIFRILKFDRWFSLVFAHKDPLYWDTIIKAAEECGFEYVNTAVVKAGIVSYHKHKNPLRVLSGELVINFIKKRHVRAIAVTKAGVEAVSFVLNSAEHSIVVRDGGATTDEIHEDLIPKLIETGLLSQLRDKISDITPLLGDRFDFNPLSARWVIPPNTKLGSYIPEDLRIRFYIENFLNQCHRKNEDATIETIWADVIPMLKNGDQPTEQRLLSELDKIAEPFMGQYYRLKVDFQGELFDPSAAVGLRRGASGLPEWKVQDIESLEHDDIIHHLALIAQMAKLDSYIGMQERRQDGSGQLSKLSLTGLPKGLKLSKYSKSKVEQIDLIWFDSVGFPAYAFEIEKSTSITSALERFVELLKVNLQVAGKIVIVCPSSRKQKLDTVLHESIYIGAPMYMERKVRYLYWEDVVSLYEALLNTPKVGAESVFVELRNRLRSPEEQRS
jgi:DNA modification methylase